MEELIKRAEANIRQAITDYAAHAEDGTDILDDISDAFICKLAKDSTLAKQELRTLFSKSPVWHPELDALIINGTRTHNPDYDKIYSLMRTILKPELKVSDYDRRSILSRAMEFFASPNQSEERKKLSIEAIQQLAPNAYAPNKKPSRIFKALCTALGVADETAGSDFQRLYAQFADELSAKQISFKLFVSINPAHFLTMSNPKHDERGSTLTSCHSLNSTEYQYNNGCSGYARDSVSFIVFTAADPTNPETLNNRKTTCQVFAYKVGSGLLLQSRLYNTSGGTSGAHAESDLYRDLIEREISALEDKPDLWKTRPSHDDEHACFIMADRGFGGYCDWGYRDFNGKLCFRNDCDKETVKPLKIGYPGLCVCCAEDIRHGLYCASCGTRHDDRGGTCDYCGDWTSELTVAYNEDGHEVYVCDDCSDQDFSRCDFCDEWHYCENISCVEDSYICEDCLARRCSECAECGSLFFNENLTTAYGRNGNEVQVCSHCAEEYYALCADCGELFHGEHLHIAYNEDGVDVQICGSCAEDYEECLNCGTLMDASLRSCPDCGAEVVESVLTGRNEVIV